MIKNRYVTEEKTATSTAIVLTLSCLALELLLEVLKEVGVEVLTTQVGVTGSGLNSEDTTLDVEQGNIEGTTTKIVDQNVALLVGLTRAQAVSDGGSSRLVNDTENVQASDGTGILGGLTLVVVEVGRDSDDSLGDLLSELGLGNFFHLNQSQYCHAS